MKTGYVTAGKPRVVGGVYRAPLGTTLPTSAREALNSAFSELGYVSDGGVKNKNTASKESTVAWGGDHVMDVQTDKPDEYSFTLIEAMNVEVLKTVYGDDNVSGDLETGITVNANSDEQEEHSFVIDMALRDGALKRIVIPDGKVTEVGEITYKNSDPVGYETTLSCLPDDAGNTHYEYLIKPASVGVAVAAENGDVEMFGTLVSDMQEDVSISNTIVTGSLKYLTSGNLVDYWGAGNFLALKFSGDSFGTASSIKVGLRPSAGSGLVEIIDDADRNGAFKITSTEQVFVVQVTIDGTTTERTYDLSRLELETE